MTQTRQDCEDTQLPSIDYNWTAPISDEEFDYFRAIAHREAGISIADFKRNMVFRRVSKRVRILGLKSIPEYRRYLDGGHWDSERQPLINALTTNKTSFFREEHHFRYLEQTVLPELTAASRAGGPRRLVRPGRAQRRPARTRPDTQRDRRRTRSVAGPTGPGVGVA